MYKLTSRTLCMKNPLIILLYVVLNSKKNEDIINLVIAVPASS